MFREEVYPGWCTTRGPRIDGFEGRFHGSEGRFHGSEGRFHAFYDVLLNLVHVLLI